MTIEVRVSSARFVTTTEARTTRHSFSFGGHYDPANVGFGPLVAHNDEVLPPGTGYAEHHHAGHEIVTVVLAGALRHTSTVGSGVLGPGDVQVLSAGTGVPHSEVSASDVTTRFVQTWLRATDPDRPPAWTSGRPAPGDGLVPLVGGDATVPLGVDARLWRARVTDADLALPKAHRHHVFVVEGPVRVGDVMLATGDAGRLTDEPAARLHADGTADVLVWASG